MKNINWLKYVFFGVIGVVVVFVGLMGYQIYLIKSKKVVSSNLLKSAFDNLLSFLKSSGSSQKPITGNTSPISSSQIITNIGNTIKTIFTNAKIDDTPTDLTSNPQNGGTVTPTPTNTEELILFVFAGESNAGNQVHNDHAPDSQKGDRNVKILNNSNMTFEPLKVGVNNSIDQRAAPAESHGWDLGLANLVDDFAFSGKKVFLVNLSQGGSFIGQYNEGADTNYRNKIITRASAAMSALRAISSNIKVYMVYSQGINDELLGTSESSWENSTRNHLSFLNTQFGGNVKVVITKFGKFLKFNNNIQNLVNSNGNYRALDTIGLSLQDDYHWDYESQKYIITQAVSILKGI